ncbi:RES family NAD+ phosphorylase [Shewanella frigidimarina]|uniref:RES family NAD+ phosphorylase n=1 Tax=Shewanella frigidimarina TaxID=56812 RepID=UPI003D7B101F
MQDFKLSSPPLSLFTDFPIHNVKTDVLKQGDLLYRCFNAEYTWDFYDSNIGGRFNGVLPQPNQNIYQNIGLIKFGTCYFASSIKGGLSESIFRNVHFKNPPFIERSVLSSKKMIQLYVPNGTQLTFVDLTDSATRVALGLDTQIFSSADYDSCYLWAQLFYYQNFDGILYAGRNFQFKCYALFDRKKVHVDDGEDLGLIGGDTVYPHLKELAHELGVLVEKV